MTKVSGHASTWFGSWRNTTYATAYKCVGESQALRRLQWSGGFRLPQSEGRDGCSARRQGRNKLYNPRGVPHGEEHPSDRQANAPENRREGQTIPLCRVPQEKSETGEDAGPLVLSRLLERGTRVAVSFVKCSLDGCDQSPENGHRTCRTPRPERGMVCGIESAPAWLPRLRNAQKLRRLADMGQG